MSGAPGEELEGTRDEILSRSSLKSATSAVRPCARRKGRLFFPHCPEREINVFRRGASGIVTVARREMSVDGIDIAVTNPNLYDIFHWWARRTLVGVGA